jgi:hypothetical protein
MSLIRVRGTLAVKASVKLGSLHRAGHSSSSVSLYAQGGVHSELWDVFKNAMYKNWVPDLRPPLCRQAADTGLQWSLSLAIDGLQAKYVA